MMNLFATDVGKDSLNDESPEMNAAISRGKKTGFVRKKKQKVNKNPVNLQCAQPLNTKLKRKGFFPF